jgi:hypothetical protein
MVSHPECCIVNEFTKNVCHAPASISLSSLRKSMLIIATLQQLWHFCCYRLHSFSKHYCMLLLTSLLLLRKSLLLLAFLLFFALLVCCCFRACDVGFCTVAISYSINFNDLHIILTRNIPQIRDFFQNQNPINVVGTSTILVCIFDFCAKLRCGQILLFCKFCVLCFTVLLELCLVSFRWISTTYVILTRNVLQSNTFFKSKNPSNVARMATLFRVHL